MLPLINMKKKATKKTIKPTSIKKTAIKRKVAVGKKPAIVGEFITKEMFVAEAVAKYPESIEVFSRYGLHCIGCFASELDTVESGAKVHGINVEHLLYDVNKHIGKEKK